MLITPPGAYTNINESVMALRRQNADFDADVAYDLAEQVCEPLHYEIERIESLVAVRSCQNRQQEAQA